MKKAIIFLFFAVCICSYISGQANNPLVGRWESRVDEAAFAFNSDGTFEFTKKQESYFDDAKGRNDHCRMRVDNFIFKGTYTFTDKKVVLTGDNTAFGQFFVMNNALDKMIEIEEPFDENLGKVARELNYSMAGNGRVLRFEPNPLLSAYSDNRKTPVKKERTILTEFHKL